MTRRSKLIDTNADYKATRIFTMDGTKYQPGDDIDTKALLEKPQGRYQFERLIKYRFIAAEGTEPRRNKAFRRHAAKPVAREGQGPNATIEIDETVTVDEQPSKTDEPQASDTTVELKHTGAGYYKLVDADGVNHIPNDKTVQGKDAARAIAEQLGLTIA